MKYRVHIQAILKSGHHLESRSKVFSHDDHEDLVSETLSLRKRMEEMVRKTVGGEPMADGTFTIGSWLVDAMEVAAVSLDLYTVDTDGDDENCYNETLVEVPAP